MSPRCGDPSRMVTSAVQWVVDEVQAQSVLQVDNRGPQAPPISSVGAFCASSEKNPELKEGDKVARSMCSDRATSVDVIAPAKRKGFQGGVNATISAVV